MRGPAVVVEVGAEGVRVHPGGRPVSAALAAAALAWIDDPFGLYDERPVPTSQLWRSLLTAAAGAGCESLVVVHPDGWSGLRVKRLVRAADSLAPRVAVVARSNWPGPRPPRHGPPALRWAAAVLAVLATVGALVAVAHRRPEPQPRAVSLIDGPVAVLIPPDWTVDRHAGDRGSSRLTAGSPTDPAAAVNIVWTYAPETTLPELADTLRRAAAAAPAGVIDFAGLDDAGGRPAVRYRETRPGQVVRWSVLLDGATRIAVGCASAPGREVAVESACEQAVRSARDVTDR